MRKRIVLTVVLLTVLSLVVFAGGKKEQRKFVLYAVHSEDFSRAMVDLFETKHPDIKVDIVVGAGTGEMLSRIQAEKDNPLGDLMWGGASELFEANANVFEPVVVENDSMTVISDPNHIWHATDLLFQTISINTDMVSLSEAPQTFKELTDSKWLKKGGIALSNPRASGTGYSLVTTMVSLYGWDYLTDVLRNSILVEGSSPMFSMVRDGEAPVGFINEDLGALWISEGTPLAMIYPKDGVSNQIGGAALIKGGKNPEEAKIFLNFLMSKEAQELQVEVMNRRPVRKDVAPPEGLGSVDELKLAAVDALWSANSKDEILDQYDESVKKAGK